jgi:hypothetical protein
MVVYCIAFFFLGNATFSFVVDSTSHCKLRCEVRNRLNTEKTSFLGDLRIDLKELIDENGLCFCAFVYHALNCDLIGDRKSIEQWYTLQPKDSVSSSIEVVSIVYYESMVCDFVAIFFCNIFFFF